MIKLNKIKNLERHNKTFNDLLQHNYIIEPIWLVYGYDVIKIKYLENNIIYFYDDEYDSTEMYQGSPLIIIKDSDIREEYPELLL